MSVNALLGIGNKQIEGWIRREVAEVNVLATIARRENVVGDVSSYNPRLLVLSRALAGKIDFEEVINRVRRLDVNEASRDRKPVRIVFLYGDEDEDFPYFADFLVSQGVYNFSVGEVDEDILRELLLTDIPKSAVAKYIIDKEAVEAQAAEAVEAAQLEAAEEQARANREIAANQDEAERTAALREIERDIPAPLSATSSVRRAEAAAEAARLEAAPKRVIVKETRVVEKVGGAAFLITVAGSVPRIGTTTAGLAIAAALARQGFKVAFVENNTHKYHTEHGELMGNFSFCEMLDEYEDGTRDLEGGGYSCRNVDVYYTALTQEANARRVAETVGAGYHYVVADCGVVGEDYFDGLGFYRGDCKIVVLGAKPNENDLSALVSGADERAVSDVRFLLNFCDNRRFAQFEGAVKNTSALMGWCPSPFDCGDNTLDIIDDFIKERVQIKDKGTKRIWRR